MNEKGHSVQFRQIISVISMHTYMGQAGTTTCRVLWQDTAVIWYMEMYTENCFCTLCVSYHIYQTNGTMIDQTRAY